MSLLTIERPTTPEEQEELDCRTCGQPIFNAELETCAKCNDALCLDCQVVIDDEPVCRRCAKKAYLQQATIAELIDAIYERVTPMVDGSGCAASSTCYAVAGIRHAHPEDAIFVQTDHGCAITRASLYPIDPTKPQVILQGVA